MVRNSRFENDTTNKSTCDSKSLESSVTTDHDTLPVETFISYEIPGSSLTIDIRHEWRPGRSEQLSRVLEIDDQPQIHDWFYRIAS